MASSATQSTTDGYSGAPLYVGDNVVFLSMKNNLTTPGISNIYKMDADGTNVTQLTDASLNYAFYELYDYVQ